MNYADLEKARKRYDSREENRKYELGYMAERVDKLEAEEDVAFQGLWLMLLNGKCNAFEFLGLVWSKRGPLFKKYPGFFYIICIVVQVMLIPMLILPYVLFAGPDATLWSNLLAMLAYIGIPTDLAAHVLVVYMFNKLEVFE